MAAALVPRRALDRAGFEYHETNWITRLLAPLRSFDILIGDAVLFVLHFFAFTRHSVDLHLRLTVRS